MWGYGSHEILNEYIRNHECRRILEIGVHDGENARTMVEAAIQHVPPDEVEYYGFDFFAGSRLRDVERKLKAAGCTVHLFKGDSVDTLPRAAQTLPNMDVMFIDGGKSYAEAKSDWEHAKTLMHPGTAVFVHNYGFSGVRRMVDAINRVGYRVDVLHPPSDYATARITRIHREA